MKKYFLIIFSIITIHTCAMNIEIIPNDIILYHISTRLNRIDKDNFRNTNIKYKSMILPQSTLNKLYAQACQNNDSEQMDQWRQQGALHAHEEIYNSFMENRTSLSKYLLDEIKVIGSIRTCIDLDPIFTYGIKANNILFITFLLKEMKPLYFHACIGNAITLSKQRGYDNITQLLETYITTEKDRNQHIFKASIFF